MNENKLIGLIKEITQSQYIGDDCAYLEALGITVSQDSLVENIHFRLDWMTAKELGEKTALVNISDIIASGAKPCYMTISLSLPKTLNENFVKDFYKGLMLACDEFGVKIIGGDLTGSEKVFISATVIGKTETRQISSRKNAKPNYQVWVYGNHGSSAGGLRLLEADAHATGALVKAHKTPDIYKHTFPNINALYAMMDTSDGLADALFKIATASNLTLEIDFDKIPFDKEITIFEDFEDLILFGGEDYGLLAVIPERITPQGFIKIGQAIPKSETPIILHKGGKIHKISSIEGHTFNHF